MGTCTSPSFCVAIHKNCPLEDIATVCAGLIGKASNDNGRGGMRGWKVVKHTYLARLLPLE